MNLTLTDKHLDVLALTVRPQTRLLVLEGTTRSSKTVAAIQAFFYRVCASKNYLHLIAALDYNAIYDNILDGEMGLLNQFGSICKISKDEIGGYYLKIRTINGDKKVLLVGYADAGKWAKILGKSIDTILVDEVNTANKKFIDECFARQSGFDYPFTIWTLNGDEPTKWIYTEYINKAEILWNCPSSIRADMDKYPKTKEWYYTHWDFWDNPIMTEQKILAAEKVYPVGSFYYTTKILGERGSHGEHIYTDYLDYDKHIKPLDFLFYPKYTVGVDVGASRAKNSITLTGFKGDFSEMGIVDKKTFQQCGYREKTAVLADTVRRWEKAGCNIEGVFVDSAEQNYIADLKAYFSMQGLPPIIGSYKATIKERIDLIIILLSRGRLFFNDTLEGKNAYSAFQACKWVEGKAGEQREDLNEWFNDVVDSVEYSATRHMKKLLKAGVK